MTSAVSNYDSYAWSPLSGLYTDASVTVPYTRGAAPVVYYKSGAAGNVTYTLNAGNSISACANVATATFTATVPDFTASLSPAVVCSGAAVTLSVTAGLNTANYTWQWSSGALNGNTTIVNPVNTGTTATNVSYTATVTDPVATCTNTRTLNMTVNEVHAHGGAV